MSALYLALIAQPLQEPDRTVLGRRVFEAHYLLRVKNVKAAAAALGIGRQHYYTLLREFRRRIYAASRQILAENEEMAADLGINGRNRNFATVQAGQGVRLHTLHGLPIKT